MQREGGRESKKKSLSDTQYWKKGEGEDDEGGGGRGGGGVRSTY